ncbi:MAG: hypothetical protein JSW71_18495 [Gemmatimonadota bacterium]|nr:MAG: hypothetical protein JSW71_18495 [Gemmatimonadota bacterium]
MRRTVVLAVLTVALAACAGQSSSSPRPNPSLIARAEIAEAGISDAYQLVQKLRPAWLQKRGATSFTQEGDVAVYLDGTRVGDREALRGIMTIDIESLEFLDAGRATFRFGAGNEHGAILVTTRN